MEEFEERGLRGLKGRGLKEGGLRSLQERGLKGFEIVSGLKLLNGFGKV